MMSYFQHYLYPVGAFRLRPDVAFARALETAQQMGWTIVKSHKSVGRTEASQRSRWMGFTDDIDTRCYFALHISRRCCSDQHKSQSSQPSQYSRFWNDYPA
jgi:hypothetical protein